MVFGSLGCTAKFYQKRADKAAYGVIEEVEKDIFGKSSSFSIETGYTGKKVDEIKGQDILNERSSGERLDLSLEKALDLAVRNSRQFQTEKERLYLTALSLTGARHRFRPQFLASSRATGTRSSSNERSGRVSSDIGVGQALLSGADIGINIANDLLKFYTGDPRRSAASALSVNIFQPLLRGAGKKIAAESLTQSSRNVIYAVRDFHHYQNSFAADIVIAYFRLLQQKETIYNEYSNYQSVKGNVEYLRARSVDRVAPLEVSRAEQSELSAKSRYIGAISRFRASLDQFKVTLGIPQTTDLRLETKEIEKLRDVGLLNLSMTPAYGFRLALEHRLPLMNEIDRFEDSKRKVAVAADRLKADLNLTGNASVDSVDDTPTRYEEFDFDKVRASVGLQLNLPIDRLNERNDYRATLISFESEIRSLGLTFDQLRNTIDNGIRDLEQLRQDYEIQKSAVALAERRVEGTRLELQAGTAIYRDVQDAQDALISSQNSVTSSLVSYLDARLGLLLELGILNSEEPTFWLNEKASKVDLSRVGAGTPALSLEAEQVVAPEALFPE